MIRFSTLDVEMPPIDPQKVRNWIRQVAENHGKRVGELYYYFCSDEKLLEINRERLGHDFYTDIVTFPLTNCETVLSSEFCISIDRIKENAETFGRSYESELHRVIIHGVLHLIGFDDHSDEDEKMMREKEEEALEILNAELGMQNAELGMWSEEWGVGRALRHCEEERRSNPGIRFGVRSVELGVINDECRMRNEEC